MIIKIIFFILIIFCSFNKLSKTIKKNIKKYKINMKIVKYKYETVKYI